MRAVWTTRLLAAVFAAFALSMVAGCGGSSAVHSASSQDEPGVVGSSSEAVDQDDDAGAAIAFNVDGGASTTTVTAADDSLIVQTDVGQLQGVAETGVSAFLGVPYAVPPVGALRWQPPVPVAPWPGVRSATTFGSVCVQLQTDGTLAPGGSEDCLTLNIWTPKTTPAKPLPVMAFIHGGFFVKGGATATWHGEETYDGAELAQRANVVVVTLQYRLGAFGFLAHPALSTPTAPHGNYALLDQMAALAWVQRNIGAFGGDKSAVTIWGQSAGGTSVAALLASPLATGLFSGAIIESGGFTAYSINTANADATAVATSLSCTNAVDVATCLRNAPADAVATSLPNSALGSQRWHFVEDGLMLPDDPVALFQSGTMNRVPVLLGNNRDELSAMINDYLTADNLTKPTDQASYEADVNVMYGKTGPAVLQLYPYSAYSSAPLTGLAQLVADDQYICPTRAAARALSALTLPNGSPLPVYRYLFTHALDRTDFGGSPGDSSFGAYHFLEVPFLFHNLSPTDFTFDSAERGLSLSMIGMWTRFAANGTPNGNGPSWPAYDANTDPYLAIDTVSTAGEGIRTEQCNFWDNH